tara:strand:- start:1653 stop:2249 length:597 start_codon:yes stop_codon:yes gene_type:complete
MFDFNEILLFLANNNFGFQFLILFYLFSVILLSFPFPITFVIIGNVYVFGWYGFLIVMFSMPIGSLLTYVYVKKLYKLLKKFPVINRYLIKKNNSRDKFYNNIYLLIIARATLPFFLVSVAMSILDISKKKFIFVTIIGQIHFVLITSIFILGIRGTIIDYNDIIIDWKQPIFFIPLIIMISLVFISRFLTKKYKIKF